MARVNHGDALTRLYTIYHGMRKRCYNVNSKRYFAYGGRGITICPEWQEYLDFKEWALAAGYTDELTIDRKNNDLGYSPDNCRWATYTTQARNKGKRVVINGSSQFMGVSWRPRNKKWVSAIYSEGQNVYLGLYSCEVEAAQARDNYITQNNLQDFVLNFP